MFFRRHKVIYQLSEQHCLYCEQLCLVSEQTLRMARPKAHIQPVYELWALPSTAEIFGSDVEDSLTRWEPVDVENNLIVSYKIMQKLS